MLKVQEKYLNERIEENRFAVENLLAINYILTSRFKITINMISHKIREVIKIKYEIFGETMPVVTFTLSRGEKLKSTAGSMKWVDDSVDMDTSMDGGIGGFLKRKLMQESGMLNVFTARSRHLNKPN